MYTYMNEITIITIKQESKIFKEEKEKQSKIHSNIKVKYRKIKFK